jgi:hypothetical protein
MLAERSLQLIRGRIRRAAGLLVATLAGIFLVGALTSDAAAQSAAQEFVKRRVTIDGKQAAPSFPSNTKLSAQSFRVESKQKALLESSSSPRVQFHVPPKQAAFQMPPAETEQLPAPQQSAAEHPCAALEDRPLEELGISIALPSGKLPNDLASACWQELNQSAGPLAAMRFWPVNVYNWNATCMCHRPLYFEEINLERHGYGCPDCLQSGVSAAHFFATVPILPYCMVVECPTECVYTLGHYRPGSCPPWRHHWPSCCP